MESRITGHTRLFGLIGSPVGHSGSPAMYNYSFAHNGLDNAYLAFDVPLDKVEDAVAAIRTFNFGGFNITMPDKAEVCKYLDDISPAAKLIGACNTVVVGEDGKLTGHNTDGIGFVRNLHEHGVEVKGKKIVLLRFLWFYSIEGTVPKYGQFTPPCAGCPRPPGGYRSGREAPRCRRSPRRA